MLSTGPRLKRIIVLQLLVTGLAACGEAAAPLNAAPLSLTVVEGQAFWFQYENQANASLTGSVTLGWEDEVSSPASEGAVLRLPDNSVIRMDPDTRFKLRRPYAANNRPVLRLLRGGLHISAQGASFDVESYREVPLSLRIVLVNMILEPQGSNSDFEIVFDGDTAKARVNSGEVGVRATDARGMLLAAWQAELVPDQTLKIIPPYTPTFTPSLTPSITPTREARRSPIFTATFTPVRRPIRPATVTPGATSTAVAAPTNTPGDGGGEPKPPRATNTPLPSPTNTPVPQTDTPPASPTNTPQPPRDTPTPGTPTP